LHPGEKEAVSDTTPETAPQPAASMPEIRQTNPEEIAEPEPTPEPEQKTIGSRVTGTEPETQEEAPKAEEEPEQKVQEDTMTIKLLSNKTMNVEGKITIPLGTQIIFENTDTWPHQIVIEQGSGLDTKRLWPGERMEGGEASSYVFSEKGTFTIRDVFSGSMRTIITVE